MAYVERNPRMTLAQAQELFEYNPLTGELICRSSEGRRVQGTVYKADGTVIVDGFNYAVTRVCWFLYHKKWPEELVDHEDRDPANNRINNLREATYQQNQHNKLQIGATGFPGVTKRNRAKPYLAKIRIGGVRINLGSFYTAEEAAEAYRQAKQKYHGEFTPKELA